MRLFVALMLPQELQRSLQEHIDVITRTNRNKQIKWVFQENLHLTLLFLGEVEEDLVQNINSSLLSVSKRFPPLYLELGGYLYLPNKKNPNTIGVAVHEQSGMLTSLYTELHLELSRLLPLMKKPTSRLKPHITLGRIKGGKKLQLDEPIFYPAFFESKQFYLVSSNLFPHGPEYRIRSTFPLIQNL